LGDSFAVWPKAKREEGQPFSIKRVGGVPNFLRETMFLMVKIALLILIKQSFYPCHEKDTYKRLLRRFECILGAFLSIYFAIFAIYFYFLSVFLPNRRNTET
jgi:hypothetical protein